MLNLARRHGGGCVGLGAAARTPSRPAVRLAPVLASRNGTGAGSSKREGAGGSRRRSSSSKNPQQQEEVDAAPAAPAAAEQQPSAGPAAPGGPVVAAGSASNGGGGGEPQRSPLDALSGGIQEAADQANAAISRTAEAAQRGISDASSLAADGVSAADEAAQGAISNLAVAAEGAIGAAADAAASAAGAVDGAAAAASKASAGASPSATGSFDSVNVRVPANMGWANNPPARGPIRDMTLTQDFDEEEVEGLKVRILAAVASLDRGLAANVREAADVDRLCRRLEDAAGPVTLRWSTSRSSPDASTMDRLAGTWRLIYSSGFNGGSLGGSRPGPPAALLPTVLGQVYQVIDADKMLLDNVVELLLALPQPQLPFLPRPDPQPAPGLRLTLRHTYEVAPPNAVTIVFESTSGRAIGPDALQGLPSFAVPELPDFLKPPRGLRSASFDVSYLDASMRVTRGDRGELRVYLRDKPLEAEAPTDYVD